MKRRRVLLVLGALAVIASRPADAADVPPLSVVGGETPRTLTFVAKGRTETATLTMLLLNSTDHAGTLTLRFIDKDGKVREVTAPATPNTSISALTVQLLTPGISSIGEHSAAQVKVQFVRPLKAEGSVSGNVIASMTGEATGGPIVVPVTITKEALADKLQFNQDKATISLTRVLGPLGGLVAGCTKCLFGESVQVGTRGRAPVTAEATINSESGGSATVDLTRSSDTVSKLRVTNINRHGSYEGKLVLDPDAEKPRTLTVAVNARDFIFWPLLFTLIGAIIGAFFLKKYEVKRNRDLVRAMIKESVDPYKDARKQPDADAARFYLDDLVPATDDAFYPTKGGCDNANALKAVPRSYCKAGKLDGDQSLADLLPEVTEVTSRFDRWRKVNAAISALRTEIAALPTDPKYAPMRDDADALVVRGNLEPDDDKAASELVLLYHAEATAAAAYLHAREMYDKQSEPWRKVHTKVDPNEDLKLFTSPATRTSANAELVALALLYKIEALKEPTLIPEDPHPDEQENRLKHLKETLGTYDVLQNLTASGQELFREARRLDHDNVDTRTPQEIRADVRRSDWVIFWLTATLTALVYLSGKYSADWGSWEDYLFAIASGAVAPSVITWTLIPYSRSYRPKAATAASSD